MAMNSTFLLVILQVISTYMRFIVLTENFPVQVVSSYIYDVIDEGSAFIDTTARILLLQVFAQSRIIDNRLENVDLKRAIRIYRVEHGIASVAQEASAEHLG